MYVISMIIGKLAALWLAYDVWKARRSGIRKPTEEELEKFRNVK